MQCTYKRLCFGGRLGSLVRNLATTTQFNVRPYSLPNPKMEEWKTQATAVVTGANKGIGYAIDRGLGKAGVRTILTARNEELGGAAKKQLKVENDLDVDFHPLDVTDQESIKSFAQWFKEKYGSLDILVNNAGLFLKGDITAEMAWETLAVNYFGVRNVTQELLPLMKKSSAGARIVIVGSRLGQLHVVGPDLRSRLADPNLTLEELDKLVGDIPKEIEAGTYEKTGWPADQYNLYSASKVGVAAYSRILARDLASRPDGSKVFVNVICPGYVNTDMTAGQGHKTVDEGADTPVWLALQPPEVCPTGGFYAERKDVGF